MVKASVANSSKLSQEQFEGRAAVFRFLNMLRSLSTRGRSSTHDRDHVVAVWVDCPKYVLPLQYKTIGLACLLEDAVKQFENNHRQ